MVGILAILIAEREDRLAKTDDPRRTEVVLADAGLSLSEIAMLTGRKYESVKTTIRRARDRTAKPSGDGHRMQVSATTSDDAS
jgi:DNA-directed RNA polymerase specialized sigma24 family protein